MQILTAATPFVLVAGIVYIFAGLWPVVVGLGMFLVLLILLLLIAAG